MRAGSCILILVSSLSLGIRALADDAKPDVKVDLPRSDGVTKLDGVKLDGVTKPDGVKPGDGVKKPDANPCGGITGRGCCDGDKLKWCVAGQIKIKDCTTTTPPQQCGWSGGDVGKNYYTCGATNGADPSGVYIRDCTAIPVPDAAIKSDAKKDTGAVADRVVQPPAGDGKPKDSGCSCTVGLHTTSGLPLLALLVLLMLARRRKS